LSLAGALLDSGAVLGPALDQLVPSQEGVDVPLRAALARDAAARLAGALRLWRRHAREVPDRAAFAGIDPASGSFRTWLAEVEDALALAACAATVLRHRVPRRASGPEWSHLIELVADAGTLATLAPRGTIPGDFATRAAVAARRRLAASVRDLKRLPRAGSSGRNHLEIGHVLVERGLAVADAGRDDRFERRVRKAVAFLDKIWPEAAEMIRARTWRVVPVAVPATVSYSSARQPGIAYIHVKSAPVVRMAEDLVHETTHIRLHEIEALRPVVTRRALASVFYSPWRREWRPLRGLVHAVCTFTAGAMFFERASASGAISPSRRRWLARRLLEERASVAMALPALRQAEAHRMLTAAGRRVVAAAAREHRGLTAAARQRRVWLASTASGRAELAAADRLVKALRSRPVRWSWE
jgi:HEXXH motif-containing protein